MANESEGMAVAKRNLTEAFMGLRLLEGHLIETGDTDGLALLHTTCDILHTGVQAFCNAYLARVHRDRLLMR